MTEDDFMGEERHPFKSGSTVGGATTDKLVLTVAMANKLGVAKLLNNFASCALRNELI